MCAHTRQREEDVAVQRNVRWYERCCRRQRRRCVTDLHRDEEAFDETRGRRVRWKCRDPVADGAETALLEIRRARIIAKSRAVSEIGPRIAFVAQRIAVQTLEVGANVILPGERQGVVLAFAEQTGRVAEIEVVVLRADARAVRRDLVDLIATSGTGQPAPVPYSVAGGHPCSPADGDLELALGVVARRRVLRKHAFPTNRAQEGATFAVQARTVEGRGLRFPEINPDYAGWTV
mmetsp:Transcript_5497/g.13783  ORF Transcript_5497/g.13783 Transcript_5497/m.13783 type:complete len:234 (+) Transcript_5497:100-801(+)